MLLCFLLILTAVLGFADADQTEFFETRVRPVLANNCYACHTSSKLGGLQLDSREALLKGGTSGPAIISGNPAESLLIRAVSQTDERLKMPLTGPKLKDQEIADLSYWIEIGAPWPETDRAPSAAAGKKGFVLTTKARNFWSFQPIQDRAIPTVGNPGWAKNAIDNFILAKLEEENLQPLKPADKRVLIRRATYDLIGLPPTPEQIEAFEKDTSPDAFAKVVDRLLASPHYGERWGRHWLDAVRYAEGDGPAERPIRPPTSAGEQPKAKAKGGRAMVFVGYGTTRDGYANAWRYRDWVIDALNQDMPYDLFVKAQIAADLLPDKEKSKELLPGLGVFGLGPWFTSPDFKYVKSRAEERQAKMDVLTKAFLGLTVTCARCHDHKYDPISQKDYTALLGIFNSSGFWEYYWAPEDQLAETRAYQAKVRVQQYTIGQFVQMSKIDVAEAAAQQTSRYMMAGRKVLLSKPQLDPGAVAAEEGLDLPTFQRWIKYLKASERDHPYLREWDALLARGGGEEDAQRLADQFQNVVLEVIVEKGAQELANIELRNNYKPDPDEAFVRLPGGLMQYELFRFKHQLAQKHIAPKRYYVWLDVVQGPTRVDDFGRRRAIFEYKDDELFERYTLEQNNKLDVLLEQMDALERDAPPEPPYVMGLSDNPAPVNARLNIRGNPTNLGEEVPRGFPAVLGGTDGDPLPFTQGSGRLELAEAIVDHPLAARVIANRIWMGHFGRGIVATTTNFGVMGDRPSHPELIDYLASRLIENNWSMKAVHREIMLSATYQLSYGHAVPNATEDPDNRLLWRANLRRLDAEQLRDSLLSVSGILDERVGGGPSPGINDPNNKQRTVYGKVTRRGGARLLQLFDFPDPNMSSDQRRSTNVPLQGLFFINSDLIWKHAGLVTSRLGSEQDDTSRIKKAYRLLYGRQPSESEIQDALEFLAAAEKRSGPDKPVFQQLTQAMLISGEFNYIN